MLPWMSDVFRATRVLLRVFGPAPQDTPPPKPPAPRAPLPPLPPLPPLALVCQQLSRDWQQTYGHPIAAVESFVDSQLFRGTAYKASNWTLLGKTDGFKRVAEDFYGRHDRSKELWVKSLEPDARSMARPSTMAACIWSPPSPCRPCVVWGWWPCSARRCGNSISEHAAKRDGKAQGFCSGNSIQEGKVDFPVPLFKEISPVRNFPCQYHSTAPVFLR